MCECLSADQRVKKSAIWQKLNQKIRNAFAASVNWSYLIGSLQDVYFR